MTRFKPIPNWVYTGKLPAFYDTESGTAVEQTARLHGVVKGLVDDYNKFVNELNTYINEFISSTNQDADEFKEHIDKIMHDYIAMIDDKIKMQDADINEAISFMKDNLGASISTLIAEMKESGELSQVVVDGLDDLSTQISEINTQQATMQNNINTLNENIDDLSNEVDAMYIDNVSKMKSLLTISEGFIIKTLGYHSVNDGGGALYRVRTKTIEDIEDGGSIHFLQNELVAELVVGNEQVNVHQFGAKGDGLTNDTIPLQNACKFKNVIGDKNKKYKIDTIEINDDVNLCNLNLYSESYEVDSTYEYKYLLNISNSSAKIENCSFESISDKTPRINKMNGNSEGLSSNVIAIHVAGNCENVNVENCLFINTSGVYITGNNNNNININNCDYKHCELGVYCYSPEANIFVDNTNIDISLDTNSMYYHAFYISKYKNFKANNVNITESGSESGQTGDHIHFNTPNETIEILSNALLTNINVKSKCINVIQNNNARLSISNSIFDMPSGRLGAFIGNSITHINNCIIDYLSTNNLINTQDNAKVYYSLIANNEFVRENTNYNKVVVSEKTSPVPFTLINDEYSKVLMINGKFTESVALNTDVVLMYLGEAFRPTKDINTYINIQTDKIAFLSISASTGKMVLRPVTAAIDTGTSYRTYFQYI